MLNGDIQSVTWTLLETTERSSDLFSVRARLTHSTSRLFWRPRLPQSNQFFRLLRYNGRSHEHTNSIEGETFYDYHMHMATERYQEIGSREDAYAEATEKYDDFSRALTCMVEDAGFVVPPDEQLSLF